MCVDGFEGAAEMLEGGGGTKIGKAAYIHV